MIALNGLIHISLDEDGLAGQWLDLRDVGLCSPKQFRTLQGLPTTAEGLAALPQEEAASAGQRFIALVVNAWRVLDPASGAELPGPSSADLDPDDIPTIVSARIRAEVNARMEEIQNLKARSRSA